tara:strand:- start:20 stop:445 length:426 start_codon:yes stop_codon:yes gene_type:complete
MKKLKIVFGIFFGILILSCSSDDDNIEINESSIIGTWQLVEIIHSENQNYTLENCQLQTTITFNLNKTGKTNEYILDLDLNDCFVMENNITYETNGNILTISYISDNLTNVVNYELEKNFLIYYFTNSDGNKRTTKMKRLN